MVNAQEQALGTENFQQNQTLFLKYTIVDGAFKKQVITAMVPVFLSPLVYHLTGFVQVSALTILQYLLSSYRMIEEINLEENSMNMMEPYEPVEPLDQLVE